MLGKHSLRFCICSLQHLHNFLIDFCRGCLSAVHNSSSVQITVLDRFQSDKSEFFRHTILCYHRSCDLGCLLNIVRCSGCNCVKHQFLCCTSCKGCHQHCFQLSLGIQELFFLRCLHHITECTHGSRNDCNLLYRFCVLLKGSYQCMTDFMV